MKKLVILAVMLSGTASAHNIHARPFGSCYLDQRIYSRGSRLLTFKFGVKMDQHRFTYKVAYVYHHTGHGEKFVSISYRF